MTPRVHLRFTAGGLLLVAFMAALSAAKPLKSSSSGNTALVPDYYDNNEREGIAVDFVTNPNWQSSSSTAVPPTAVSTQGERRRKKKRRDLRYNRHSDLGNFEERVSAVSPQTDSKQQPNTDHQQHRRRRLRHRKGSRRAPRFKLTVWGDFDAEKSLPFFDELRKMQLRLLSMAAAGTNH